MRGLLVISIVSMYVVVVDLIMPPKIILRESLDVSFPFQG